MSLAIIANGTLLQMYPSGSGGSPTTIPEVKTLSGPAASFDLLDVTSHDSDGGFREFIPGLSDGDAINCDLHWRPSNTLHQALRTNSYARTLTYFDTVFPDSDENTVKTSNYIKSITPKADIGAVLMASISLKVTGLPEWS